jgi:hypothetical protein
MKNRKSLEVGERFGILTVVSDSGTSNADRRALWNMICDCGKSKLVSRSNLTNGGTQSCGCKKGRPPSRRKDAKAIKPDRERPVVGFGDIRRGEITAEIDASMADFLKNNEITVL